MPALPQGAACYDAAGQETSAMWRMNEREAVWFLTATIAVTGVAMLLI
jgi:hypothetical protein